MPKERSQQVPHEFVICRDGEQCYWPECIAHGCMADDEPRGNLVLHGETPEQEPVIFDTSNL